MEITKKRVLKLSKTGSWVLTSFLLLSACTPVVYEQTTNVPPPPPQAQVVYVAPGWAPPYGNVQQVQYYFLPDIDVYYNVYTQQFVYNDGYSWIYVQNLPPAYSAYDLNSAYVVFLDQNTRSPWLNNQVYVEHYPRYYYNNYYSGNQQYYNNQPIRGYNENIRQAVYAPRGSWHNNNAPANQQPANNTGNRQSQSNEHYYNNTPPANNTGNTQPQGGGYNNNSQPANNTGNMQQQNGGYNNSKPANNTGNGGGQYSQPPKQQVATQGNKYGNSKNIGQPVPVKSAKPIKKTTNKQGQKNNTGTGARPNDKNN